MSFILLMFVTATMVLRVVDASIAGYEPKTTVTEENSIDLDQQAIEALLAQQTDAAFAQARTLYDSSTIQWFSTNAETEMRRRDQDTEFYPDFQKFLDYFGMTSFADDFVVAAFDKQVTTSGFHGNFDFTKYGFEGREEVIKKSTAFLAITMYVLRELEVAIEFCEEGCRQESLCDDSANSLDAAVAHYTGSLEGSDGSGNGFLMYALADKRCREFRTCGANGGAESGTSMVNQIIFDRFKSMQQNLVNSQCAEARANKEEIAKQIFVPFVQGALRFAHMQATKGTTEKDEAAGVMHAAAVLPVLAVCNQADSKIIYNQMKPGEGSAIDFNTIKDAFERNYNCMGISCADVGGFEVTASAPGQSSISQLCGFVSEAPTVTRRPTRSPTLKPTFAPAVTAQTPGNSQTTKQPAVAPVYVSSSPAPTRPPVQHDAIIASPPTASPDLVLLDPTTNKPAQSPDDFPAITQPSLAPVVKVSATTVPTQSEALGAGATPSVLDPTNTPVQSSEPPASPRPPSAAQSGPTVPTDESSSAARSLSIALLCLSSLLLMLCRAAL